MGRQWGTKNNTRMKTLIAKWLGLATKEQVNEAWAESESNFLKLTASRVEEARLRAEEAYLRSLLNERYEGDWKVTKDGTKRYRKVATKVLVNAWVTESEPI